MRLPRVSADLVMSSVLPALLGAMLAFAASNLWFYFFAAFVFPGFPGRSALPDFFAYLMIDMYVGAGCAYAGSLTGPGIASLLGQPTRLGRFIPALYSAVLSSAVTLTVNAVLLFMSYI